MSKIAYVLFGTFTALVISLIPAAAQEQLKQTLIKNVSVWNGTSDAAIKADILVEGNKIVKIAEGIDAGSSTIIVDGKGGTVIPGLIDTHQHIMLAKG